MTLQNSCSQSELFIYWTNVYVVFRLSKVVGHVVRGWVLSHSPTILVLTTLHVHFFLNTLFGHNHAVGPDLPFSAPGQGQEGVKAKRAETAVKKTKHSKPTS